ncbi:hypothetical protein CBS101457_003198 [Exobasidium rhododendri]|nr:hypothetical protein CBS101457_003198 [Exobasidium rhododendri]
MSSAEGNVIRGHCACGSLRYTIDVSNIDRDLKLSMYCHCSQCQRLNGAPFVWSTHWSYPSVTWDPPAQGPPPGAPVPDSSSSSSSFLQPSSPSGHFSPKMQTYENMKGRKWKLRCKDCGSPIGSWNAAKSKWTIWGVTLEREEAKGEDKGILAQGEYNVPPDVMTKIKPDHHQFYEAWRAMDINDKLEKWTGYRGESTQVDAEGTVIR